MSKKYEISISQDDSTWAASILRKVSSKKTNVTKAQAGFATEAEAKEWADTELKTLLAVLVKRNKADNEKRDSK